MASSDHSDLLSDFEDRPVDLSSSVGEGAVGVTAAPKSPTVLNVDEWGLRKGLEVLNWSPDMLEHCEEISQEVDDVEAVAADFYAAAFEPNPTLHHDPADKDRAEYMEALMSTSAYRSLHTETTVDVMASRLASVHFAKGYCDLLDERKEEQQQEEQPGDGPGQGQGGGQGEPQPSDRPPSKSPMEKEMEALGAASKALDKATQDVDKLGDMKSSFGCGDEEGTPMKANSLKDVQDMFRKVRDSRMLRRVIEEAGRYRRVAQSKQREKMDHGQDDIVGVTIGGDVAHLLPCELAKLSIPELELDTMRRIVERQAMMRDWQGIEPKGKGPIVCIIDESGSMAGNEIVKAKAIGLAIYWIARHQKRGMVFRSFAYYGNKDRVLAIHKDTMPGEVMDYMEGMLNGGTTHHVPFESVPKEWEGYGFPAGSADIILLTDAYFDIPEGVVTKYLIWKEEKNVKLHTIVITSYDRKGGDLERVSDSIRFTKSIDHDTDVVGELFSL